MYIFAHKRTCTRTHTRTDQICRCDSGQSHEVVVALVYDEAVCLSTFERAPFAVAVETVSLPHSLQVWESLGQTLDQVCLFAYIFVKLNLSSQIFTVCACVKCRCECTEIVKRVHRESLGQTLDQFYLFAYIFAELTMSSQTFTVYTCVECRCECTERVKRVYTESLEQTLDQFWICPRVVRKGSSSLVLEGGFVIRSRVVSKVWGVQVTPQISSMTVSTKNAPPRKFFKTKKPHSLVHIQVESNFPFEFALQCIGNSQLCILLDTHWQNFQWENS